MRRFIFVLSVLVASILANFAQAQSTTLLADKVIVTAKNTLIASGNVEVLYGDVRLRASKIIYDNGTLTIEGPIVLVQGESTVIFANAAELDADLRNGVLTSARLVLDQQLQLAAAEIRRVDGRYVQLYKTVASSCQICKNNPIPLWQIRAKKVVHDTEKKQLYFYNAQFRVGNVPIAYIPRLRMPDPTVKRSTGLLVPSFRNSTRLGTGIKLPYFITLGDHADLTVTPYISAETKTVELRYRQAFHTGRITINGAVTRDTILPGETRSYLNATGNFAIPYDFGLSFNVGVTSDSAYLLTYGYSGKDRLDSRISVNRTRHDEYISADLLHIRTLRGTELTIEDQLPSLHTNLTWSRRFYPTLIGGQGSWQVDMQGHRRSSDVDISGRDMLRIGSNLQWGRNWILDNGMIAEVGGDVTADLYKILQDSDYQTTPFRITPAVEVALRWPMIRTTRAGAYEVLEPIVHLAWSNTYGDEIPNSDSTEAEFDPGNLFAISRFPGADRHEQGLRAAIGANWARHHPSGISTSLTFGRVFRNIEATEFSAASGLDGKKSDWLGAVQVKLSDKFAITSRLIWDDDLELDKAEARMNLKFKRFSVSSSYVWMIADDAEIRPFVSSLAIVNADYDFTRHWSADVNWRYDFEAEKATRAKIGLVYRNECVRFDLSLSRRFTSSSSVDPTTSIGMSVGLNGFGSDGRAHRRTCRY